jgi:hypothetical protein
MNRSTLAWLMLTACSVFGQGGGKFPIYSDQRIARPEGLPEARVEDFKIALERVDGLPAGHLYGDRAALLKLGRFYRDDPAGQAAWMSLAESAVKTLNRWDFSRKGFGSDRYIYNVPALDGWGLVYLFTGHPELGRFITDHLRQVAELPLDFWVHAELRGLNPERPLGMLETGGLCVAFASALSSIGPRLGAGERLAFERALREKGLTPCLNWLDKPWKNNFTAVIGTGAYAAARYLGDAAAAEKALSALAGFVGALIEADGSYGEGSGYFSYPISSLQPALLCMDAATRARVFDASGLRGAARWQVYPYFYQVDENGKLESALAHFGDNGSSLLPSASVLAALISLYQDPQAAWLLERFERPLSLKDRLLLLSAPRETPKAVSPEEAGLPLMRAFSNGDCFIKSSWKTNGITLALRSGGASRVEYSHQRAEKNSFVLGAFGEYLVVSPGSASYRSPLHYTWDAATRSANTVTVDGKNQLFPGKGTSAWIKVDVKSFWVEGRPTAEVVQMKTGEFADLLVSEAKLSYHVPLRHARRAVLFVREPGYFVIVDHLAAEEGDRRFDWRLHLNQRDGKARLEEIGAAAWRLTRPRATLDIHLWADLPISTGVEPGHMHGPNRDYSPGGENEGKPGSSIELAAWNAQNSRALTLLAVLLPRPAGAQTFAVRREGDSFRIGEDAIRRVDGALTLTRSSRGETFRLW